MKNNDGTRAKERQRRREGGSWERGGAKAGLRFAAGAHPRTLNLPLPLLPLPLLPLPLLPLPLLPLPPAADAQSACKEWG